MLVFTNWRRAALWLLAIGLCPVQAWPQASTARVSGTVRDQAGAVIPQASVVLTNSATNLALKSATNQVGFYLFGGVIPGAYRLVVESPGMQKWTGGLTVQVGQSAVVDPVLEVGLTVTEVSVRDVTPLVATDNPTLGHVLERERIEQLPINGRNVLTLLQTVPGMEGTRAFGLREGSHEVVLDGAAMSDRLWGGAMRRMPGLDTIQEFKVENNNSSAKFTRPTTVLMSTKSGTNAIRGALFETLRNNSLGVARRRQDYFAKAPQLIRNEFGGSAGGPVYLPKVYNGRDRTFWFVSYEGYRQVSRTNWSGSVPTEAMRRGDFRGLVDAQGRQFNIYNPWTTDPRTWARQQFAHNGQLNVIDPNLMSPLAKHLYSVTPLPTHPEVNPLVAANWWGTAPYSRREWTVTARLDHSISDNDRIYARYTQGDQRIFSQDWNLPMLDGIAGSVRRMAPNKTMAVSYVRTFSPTFFNELLVSGAREFWWKGTGEPGVKYTDRLGLPNPFDVAGWPAIYNTGFTDYVSDNAQASGMGYVIIDNNATKIAGRHEFQFGYHYRYDQLNLLPDQQQNQGLVQGNTLGTSLYDARTSATNPLATPFTGHEAANTFLGIMNYSNQFVRGYFYARGREYAGYFQDNYKATPRLTLNLGVRWEYWPAFKEKRNIVTGFDPNRRAAVLGASLDEMYKLGATVPAIVNRLEFLGAKFITWDQAGLPRNLMSSSKRNFGPRLGFAYRAGSGASSLVLRGGYRVSYFHIPARPWVARMRSNAPLTARFNNSLTDPALSPDGIGNYGMRSAPTIIAGKNSRDAVSLAMASGLTRGSPGASYFAPNQPDARVQDWNFTLEKEIVENTLVRAAYVGNRSSNLEQFYQYNLPTPDYIWFVTTGERLPTGEFAGVARRPYDKVVWGSVEEYRMTGWGNFQGLQFELERRYSKGYGFQLFYVVSNNLAAGGQDWSGTSVIPEVNQFLPGLVPSDVNARNRLLNYQRDSSTPKHRVRWNWIVDLPFGKAKPIGSNAGAFLDRVIGGWQVAGIGSWRTRYFALPTGIFPNGNKIEIYGKKYPVEDCTSGVCYPAFLWWNGYIPANRINSVDPVSGRPNGIMGVPANYQPAGQPLIPWPKDPKTTDPLFSFYGTNTVWVTLNDGTSQRTTFNDGYHPWQRQYFPAPGQWVMDASIFKTIPINERVHLRFNADFFNVFNRPGTPGGVATNGLVSTRVSDIAPRELQLTLRLTW